MLTVVTVLKSGGEYKPEHVHRLRDQVGNDARFVCLTDMPVDCVAIDLWHGWAGWWSKIELFRPGLFNGGPIVYLDLDSTIVGNVAAIERKRFTMLSDFYRPNNPASGVMAWNGDYSHIYDAFAKAPEKFMKAYRTQGRWGDQGFIRDHLCEPAERFGSEVVSYKVHCKDYVPKGAIVVAYHGKPKPWDKDGCLPEAH